MIKINTHALNIPVDMVLIPEGPFLMGSTKEDIERLLDLDRNIEVERLENEMPQREVFLSAYLIDKYPVTNAQYKNSSNLEVIRKNHCGQMRDGNIF